jgi:dephospho-CoA kinase
MQASRPTVLALPAKSTSGHPRLEYISEVTLRVFGLTGGIGSGKSTVAQRLRERGLAVVNADQLARLAVAPGSPGLAQIVVRFGPDVLTAAGELDRARLAERVFSDADARRTLDAIVHPIVRELAAARFRELGEQAGPLACYEVPLLYEVGLERALSPVVVVSAPPALIRARLATRDGLSEAQIDARIAAQLPLAEKARRADYVIQNDGSIAELETRVDAAFDVLCSALGVDAARYARRTLS